MSEQTLQLVALLRRRLQATVRRITLAELAFGLVLTLGLLTAGWLLSVAFEAGLWLGTTPRTLLLWTLATAAVGLFAYFLLLPGLRLAGLLRPPSEEDVARRIGRRYPEVGDRLVNLLQLSEGRASAAPTPLLDGAVRMLGEQVHPVPFEHVEDFVRARRASRFAAIPIAAMLLFLLAAPTTFLDASRRLLAPGTDFQRPAPFQLEVLPGSVDLVKGSALDVVVRPTGQALPRSITLSFNHLDEDHVETVVLEPDSTGAFRHRIANVRRSLRYQAAAAPVTTPWFTASVTERPIVRGLQVSLTPPAYTGIPPQRLEPNVGDVSALPGTRVGLTVGVGGQQLDEALIRFDDGTEAPLNLQGFSADGSFMVRRAGTYQLVLRNAEGIENSEPITYTVSLLPDAHPSVLLLAPEATTDLNEALQTDVHLRINDDFGFSRLALFYRLAESRFETPMETFVPIELPLEDRGLLDQEHFLTWLLRESTPLDPVPGDVIEFYVQVWDNDAFAGYKASRSDLRRLRLPSLSEQYRQLEEAQNGAESTMEDLLQESEQVRKQFEELRDELRQKPEANWEDQRQLEQLQQRQSQLEQQVEDLTEQVERMTEQMRDNSLVDEKTVETYQELRKVMEEVNSPELQEALRQLQQALENMDLQQMQQSMGDFEFNAEQYQQRLERALDLFKRVRVEQKLQEAARRAEALARQQERLAEETERLKKKDANEKDGQQKDGEQRDGEQKDVQQKDGQQKDGQQKDGQQKDGQQKDGQQKDGQQKDGQQKDGQQKDGQQKDGQQKDGEQKDGEQKGQERTEEDLAREQERASEEMKELEKALDQLREQMEELRNTPQNEMQQLQQEVGRQQLPQKMQQNADELRQQQHQKAQQQQQQMQQQLSQMQQQLSQMQQNMQGQQTQVNMAGLRRALSDVLTLSQQQEDLRRDAAHQTPDSPALRAMAQQQIELAEGLSVVSDSLQRLSREIPQMSREVQQQAGEALRVMGQATEAMAERQAAVASGFQKGSMMHLNELGLLLSDLLDQLMNMSNGGGGGMSMQQMMQQLQNMSGQQQQLNEQIQQFLNDMQGNRLSQDAQQRLDQMARQQEALQRQLKELGRNPEARGKMLGDLNKIAEQMEETIRELQRRQVAPRTIERQQQILSRLLDAQRSLRERGKEKRRESQSGTDRDRPSPGALPAAEEAEKLRRDLIRALESGYAPDYQELIKRYFELLQKAGEQ